MPSNKNLPAGLLRVLLADDNIVEQKIAERMIQGLGYRIDVVSNGFEAVQAVRMRPYDFVLVDEDMPEMDVFETASRIRRLPALSKKPRIIALVAHADQFSQARYFEAGIDDAIPKPISEYALRRVLVMHKVDAIETPGDK